jgi:hypothetical protein
MVFNNNLLLGAAGQSGGYTIDQSILFNDGDGSDLVRTLGAGDQKTWTFSLWVKRGELGDIQLLTRSKWRIRRQSTRLYFLSRPRMNFR